MTVAIPDAFTEWEAWLIARRGPEALCRTCRYWELSSWDDELKLANYLAAVTADERVKLAAKDRGWSEIWGECKRHAPAPSENFFIQMMEMLDEISWAVQVTAGIKHKSEYEREARAEIFGWPTTSAEDWCGDFAPGRVAPSREEIARFEALWQQAENAERAERAEREAALPKKRKLKPVRIREKAP